MTTKEVCQKHGVNILPGQKRITQQQWADLVPRLTSEELFVIAKSLADKKVSENTNGMMDWDTLPDTNSLWDHISAGMSFYDLKVAVIEAVDERLMEAGFPGIQ